MSITSILLSEISDAKNLAINSKIYKAIAKKWMAANKKTMEDIHQDARDALQHRVDGITNSLLAIDPTKNKMYVNWLVQIFIISELYTETDDYIGMDLGRSDKPFRAMFDKVAEDGERIREYLTIFHQNKPQIKREGHSIDINSYETPQELLQVIKPYTNQGDNDELIITKEYVQQNFSPEEAEVVYEDSEWIIVTPKTQKAACILGQDSEWCTADGEYSPKKSKRSRTSYYSHYTDDTLYILQDKSNPSNLYQFQFDAGEFKDKEDADVQIINFLEEHPDLNEFFDSQGKYANTLKKAYDLLNNDQKDESVDVLNNAIGDYGAPVLDWNGSEIYFGIYADDFVDELLVTLLEWYGYTPEHNIDTHFFRDMLSWALKETPVWYPTREFRTDNVLNSDNILLRLYSQLSKEEKKQIISTIIKKSPSTFKSINLKDNLDSLFNSVVNLEMKENRPFKNNISSATAFASHRFNMKKVKEFFEVLKDALNWIGFVPYEGIWVAVGEIDEYWADEEFDMLSHMAGGIDDSIHMNIKDLGEDIDSIEGLSKIIKGLSNVKKALELLKVEFTLSDLIQFYMTDGIEEHLKELLTMDEFRNVFIKHGYLETETIPATSSTPRTKIDL